MSDLPPSDPSRREFVRAAASSGLVAATGLGLTGCFFGEADFLHGVASGDPLADRVMLWSRVTLSPRTIASIARAELEARQRPDLLHKLRELQVVALKWEVALDADFKRKVRTGVAVAEPERDYTVKVDVDGLQPGRTYYYRFLGRGLASPVGRTKTLPALVAGGARQVRLAVFSCSNYPAGYFNVYGEAAKIDDLDAAVHLGDYIYEYGRDGYASQRAGELGRLSAPAVEILTLNDYRTRHAQYRTDPDLQELSARVPLIAVWDDHELANDAWTGGAQNHDPATEGPWAARRAAAIRAYYEWMPIREVQPGRPERIFRSFDFGTLVSLHMLDTRVIGRDRQLDFANYQTPAGFNVPGFVAAISDPARQLLGAEQTAWLQNQMARSSATWQILGQQVLMGRMNVPAPILFQQITVGGFAALLQKAQTAPGSLTAQELAILQAPSVPYNLDAWDGYAAAREAVLGTARELNRNLVALAGDTHNAWASNLADAQGNAIGVEFATASVSSPGFEAVFPGEDPVTFARGLEALIGPLVYADTSRRGFLLLTATATECRAEWRFVSSVFDRSYTASAGRTLRTLPGSGNRRLIEA
jgi:alkaline phosphatase D